MKNPLRISCLATDRVGSAMLLVLLCCFVVLPTAGFAGEWRVAPIKLELGSDARSGVISVVNEGTGKFQVQMKAFLWEQDADGKDQLTETKDLIFFPKIMVFEKPEERILRAGIKIPAATKEKTYRLFIEEIPEPKKADGTNIAVAIRFGVPIFVKPLKEDPKGEIAKLELVNGECRVTVKNSGNVHFIITAVNFTGKDLKGQETFAKKLDGWYLLNGASRVYTAALPKQSCAETATLAVEITTNKFVLDGKLDVDKSLCQ
ncbi:MAG: fimbria/pilus periplasmic chaperone [Geobacteraceae bacterium]|nr:fimbria/pilus periplasmic chaperone [Geobacteraceae bacterium]